MLSTPSEKRCAFEAGKTNVLALDGSLESNNLEGSFQPLNWFSVAENYFFVHLSSMSSLLFDHLQPQTWSSVFNLCAFICSSLINQIQIHLSGKLRLHFHQSLESNIVNKDDHRSPQLELPPSSHLKALSKVLMSHEEAVIPWQDRKTAQHALSMQSRRI